MQIIFRAAFAIAAVATMMGLPGSVERSEATIIYPWCAHYGGRNGGGADSCGSTTYAQCMATASPNGYCSQNPFYQGPVATAPAPRTRRVPN